MAIPGQYNIGAQTYDIDPAFTDLLYSPQQTSFQGGFQMPQFQPAQVAQAPAAEAPKEEGYIPDDTRNGGDMDTRNRGIDPNSGLGLRNDVNFDQSAWWGGNYEPNVGIGEALKGYGPMIMSASQNPMMTAIKSMKLDPINDKVLQTQLTGYLDKMAPDVSLEDFISAYKQVVGSNWNSKLNAEDTIRGLAMGYDPAYADAYRTAISDNKMRPDEFAGWVDTVNMYNATQPGLGLAAGSVYEPLGANVLGTPNPNYNTNFSPAYNYAKTYGFFRDGGLSDFDMSTIDRLNQDYERRASFNERVSSIGNMLGLNLDNGMRTQGSSFVSDGYGSQTDYAQAVADAIGRSQMNAVNDLGAGGGGGGGGGDGTGTGRGDGGKGAGGQGQGGTSGGDRSKEEGGTLD
jgi:hypothetical protein